MKNKLFNEIRDKFSSDNFSKQKAKIENFIDENSDYNDALRINRLTNSDSQSLEHVLGAIIYNSTVSLGSGLYDISDKLSWKKIHDIASSYRNIINPLGKKLNTSYKAAVLMALIIQNNIIDDEDNRIRLALDSALYYMCEYNVEYKGTIPMVQKKIRYDYNIPNHEKILKYIKVYKKNKSDVFYENGGGPIYEIPKALAKEFEPLLMYIHKCLILQEENKDIICNIYEAANKYDETFSEEETEEKSEKVISNKGIPWIFRRKK